MEYIVVIKEVSEYRLAVEADSVEDARDMATNLVADGKVRRYGSHSTVEALLNKAV